MLLLLVGQPMTTFSRKEVDITMSVMTVGSVLVGTKKAKHRLK